MLSIVVPVYNEERNIAEFIRRMEPVAAGFGCDYEVIFALDPSTDRSEQVVLDENLRDPRVKLLLFSRRVGQPMATLGGMQYARGDAVVVMDVDMQDPPELVVEMLKKWREGFDVVYARRRNRDGETALKKLVVKLGYGLIGRISEVKIPQNTGDFRLMSRRVVEEVLALKECHGFLRGMVALAGFRQAEILFDRPARFSGDGNYNRFTGSLRIGFNGIFCFSSWPLTLATKAGLLVTAFALLLAVLLIFTSCFNIAFPVSFLGIALFFLGGVQLISIGILGEYIGRIYDEVKQRPRFIVDRAIGFEPVEQKGPRLL